MTGFDFVVLAILVVSGVLGLVRGLLKEVLSLVAYLLAFVAAIWWGPTVYAWLSHTLKPRCCAWGFPTRRCSLSCC